MGSPVAALKNLWLRLVRPAFVLDLDGELRRYKTPEEFEFAMRRRTDVAPETVRAFGALDEERIAQRAREARLAQKRSLDLLLRAIESGARLSYVWQRLDIDLAPEDHQWPLILFALGDPAVPDAYRRIGLAKYLQYLNARREVLASLWREKHRQLSSTQSRQLSDEAEPEPASAPSVPQPFASSQPSIPGAGGPVEHSSHTGTAGELGPTYVRLPRGRAMVLGGSEGEAVSIFLAHRRFRVRRQGRNVSIADDTGREHELRPGRNVLGRSRGCDVKVNDMRQDISRRHLLIDIMENGEIRLVDMSSRGTFVPAGMVTPTRTGMQVSRKLAALTLRRRRIKG